MFAEAGLVDIWREKHPTSREYSFYSHSHKTYARIDYFLGTTSLTSLVHQIEIQPRTLSCHSAVSLMLSLRPGPATPCSWRLRYSLLHRPDVVKQISKALQDYLSVNDNSKTQIATLWDALKAVVRGEFIAITASDNKIRSEKREQLTHQTQELERIHQRTGAPRVWRQLEAMRSQLAALDLDRAEYAALRLCHNFYTGGD